MKKITCKINDNLTVELRNVVETYGHDDSIPFNADIYVFLDGKKRGTYAGYAYNDGWGGMSTIHCENEKVQPILKQLNKDLRKNRVVPYESGGRTTYLDADFEFLVNLMVEECLYCGVKDYDFEKNFVPKKSA